MKLTPCIASNDFVSLRPLDALDREALREKAADPSIWAHWPRDVLGTGWDAQFDLMLADHKAGRWLIHVVRTAEGEAIGQTCYMAIRNEHKGVEIGGTWYHPSVHGTKINPSCKLLLLDHAFSCGAERVELKTDALNLRSRAAILKLGAQFEGIFRHHMLRPNGTWRDTAWYSILRDDWSQAKAGLEARL